MTPEEEQQFLSQLQGGPPPVADPASGAPAGYVPPPGVSDTAGIGSQIYNRLQGVASRYPEVPGTLAMGPIGQAVGRAYKAIRDQERKPERPDGVSVVDRGDQASSDAAALGADRRFAPIDRSQPMDTPLADVRAAPTLSSMAGGAPMRLTMPGGGGIGDGGVGALRKKFNDSQQNEINLIGEESQRTGRLGVAQADRIDATSDLDTGAATYRQAQAEQAQRDSEEIKKTVGDYWAGTMKLTDEIGSFKKDPNRIFKDQGIAGQITMAIGGALGGMLQGLKGGPNEYLAHIDRMIDRDLEAQQAEQDNRKQQLSARGNTYQQLLQSSGDPVLAKETARGLMWESVKAMTKAQADRLGIPEVLAKSDILTNAVDQKQATTVSNVNQAAYQWAQKRVDAANAAAAAERKAAEDRAWKLAEYGLKKDELDIKRIEAGNKESPRQKEDDAQLNEATKRLSDKDLSGDRDLVNSMHANIRKDGSIVGFDTASRTKMGIARGLTGGLVDDTKLARAALGDQERIAQKDWNQLGLMFRHKMTGSGGSDKELQGLAAAYEGAGSNAERRTVIERAKAWQDRQEAMATAVLSDDQKAELARRQARDGQRPDMPNSVKRK